MNVEDNKDSRQMIGRNIKRIREQHSMSQNELAKLLWVDRSSLSGYEIGKRLPDVFTLWHIADAFDVSLDELVGRSRK